MQYKTVSVVGCGLLGSMLVSALALKTNDPDFYFKKIELIDPDLLIRSNFPYGFLTTETFELFLNYPKVYALEASIQHLIHPNVELVAKYKTFPEDIDINAYYIDCRDSSSCSSLCKIKASCEGPYGRIIINPTDSIGDHVNYSLFPSKFYALQISTIICDIIFNNKIEDNITREIPINLLRGAHI